MAEPTVTIRPAMAADQLAIRNAVWRNNLNPLGLAWQNFTVAVDEQDNFIGCGQIKRHTDIAELASLVVVDSWQGKGISNLLLKDLIHRAGRPLWLMCESPLIPYYQKHNFEEVKNPAHLPLSFRGVHWLTRFPMGFLFFARGTYVAFMTLPAD